MRRLVAVLMMLLCLPVAGCQKQTNPMQEALDFRTSLLSSEGCSFVCDVEADYGEKVYSFSLLCRCDDDGAEMQIIAPENIAGITATVCDGETTLSFDGVRLEYGNLANGYVAPLACPWLLTGAWSEDYIAYAGADGDATRVTWLRGYNDEELTIDTWFSSQIPVFAEISYDGQRVLTIKIRDFILEK